MVTLPDDTVITDCVTVTDTVIYIDAQQLIAKDFSMMGKEYLMDIFGRYYNGQRIYTVVFDGENIELSGFVAYLEYLCKVFAIPYNQVTIESHSPATGFFNHVDMRLGIFANVKQYLSVTDRTLDQASFVGMSLGRLNPTRLRLAYEVDKIFVNDNYTIFQPDMESIEFNYRNYQNLYQQELEWVRNKQFDKDLGDVHSLGSIGWQESCASYKNIWNRFQIEIVSETDVFSNYWFTEKTARCLATGKPFTLVAGTGSLKKLHSMGFKTFGDVIDESYNQEPVPYRRIAKMLESLHSLYTDPNRTEKLNSMYAIAQDNIILYNEYIKL